MSSNIDEQHKWTKILMKLDEMSRNSSLIWLRAADRRFFTEIKGTFVELDVGTVRAGELLFVIRIKDGNDNLIDSFTDEDFDGHLFESKNNRRPYVVMDQLMEFLIRKDSGADEVLDKLLNDLDELS